MSTAENYENYSNYETDHNDNDESSRKRKFEDSTTEDDSKKLKDLNGNSITSSNSIVMSTSGSINELGTPNPTNIFVSNLTTDIDDVALKAMFEVFGPVISTKIMLDPPTKTSKGYGFVKFQYEKDAMEAISKMNGTKSGHKNLACKLAENKSEIGKTSSHPNGTPGTNLYVKGLPTTMNEEQVYNLFKPYGEITQHKLLKDAMTGMNRGQGFVRFETLQSAEYAISALNGYVFPGSVGRGLVVRYADSENEKEERKLKVFKRTMTPGDRFSPHGRSPFGSYNTGFNIGYPNTYPTMNPYQYYGGYTGYEDPNAYGSATSTGVNTMPQSALSSVPPTSSVGSNITRVPSSGMGMAPNMVAQGGMPGADSNLFIYHLPPNADDTLLYKLFSPFGPIISVKIVRDSNTGQCKGFGFVMMGSYQAAVAAINGLNGVKVESKHLIISFKK